MASLVAGMAREWEAAAAAVGRPAEQPPAEAAAAAAGEGEPAAGAKVAGDAEMQLLNRLDPFLFLFC